jgi:flagellar biosynthesis component FlhA
MVHDSFLYAPYRHAAIKKQYELMNGMASDPEKKVSAHVEHLAAKALYEMLAVPDTEHTLTVKQEADDRIIEQQRETTNTLKELIQVQKMALEKGIDIEKAQKIFHKKREEKFDDDFEEAEIAE